MATGFIPRIITLVLVLAPGVAAAEVALIGTIGERAAVLAVDGGEPKTVKVGQKWAGVTVISVARDRATVELRGKRRTLLLGQHHRSGSVADSTRPLVRLTADARGHFGGDGTINGNRVRFLVDTGASQVALPASDARRLGIDYRKGEAGLAKTASGTVQVYRVTLDSVKLGGIELAAVEGIVIEEGLDIVLLGMSFLNRVEMQREGETMTLIRRF
jgi:aspartyl protease family protein